jgi:hypothetical protein
MFLQITSILAESEVRLTSGAIFEIRTTTFLQITSILAESEVRPKSGAIFEIRTYASLR